MNMLAPAVVTQRPTPWWGLRKCCCCCSLQAGCIIIGTISLLIGLFTFSSSLYVLIIGGQIGLSYHAFIKFFMLVYGALYLLAGPSLIYGADKRRSSFITFWLLLRYLEFIFMIVAYIYILIKMLSYEDSTGKVLTSLTSFTINAGIFWYCMAIVHSFCKDVSDSENTYYPKNSDSDTIQLVNGQI